MANPSYRVIADGPNGVIVRQRFDFTDPVCPGILVRCGKPVEGAVWSYRDIIMSTQQAAELGLT